MNKVVHLMRWCLPFTASFIRNQIVYHQKYLPVVIFAQKKAGPFYDEISGKFETFCPLNTFGAKLLYKKFRIFTPNVIRETRDYIIRQRPDVLHVHYGVDCIVYADVIRKVDLPTCVSFYGYDCSSFSNRFYGYGKKLLKKNVFENSGVNVVLAMSEDMKKNLVDMGCPKEKIIVHYYGTETAPFYLPPTFSKKEATDLLIISSYQEKKGHFFLLEAFELLTRSLGNKIRLNIVGDGPLRKEIQEHVDRTRLDNIFLRGPVRYGSKEHLSYLQMADIFIHPSVTTLDGEKEGIPGAIIEAMAAGLPVISTYHAGIPSIIEHNKTGVLVPEYDIIALKEAMQQLVANRDLRKSIASSGQKYAVNYLDVNSKEKELEEIYDRLI